MAEEKRYWWLKMEHDFFEQKEMKALKRMAAGYVYTTIYLKLLLKSLKNNGSLYFESIEDDFVSELAFDIDESIDDVSAVFDFLKRKGLLVEISEEEVSLPGAVQRIGSKTQSAVRKERQRAREKEPKNVIKSRQDGTLSQDGHVEKSREEKRRDRERVELEQQLEQEESNASKNGSAAGGKNLIFEKLKQAFGEMSVNGTMIAEVEDLLAIHGQALLIYALDETILNAGKSIRYTRSILERWQGQGLRTVEQVKKDREAYETKKHLQHQSEPMSREEWLKTRTEENPF